MKPDEHEYKVMGLAAYASPEYYQRAYKVFKRTQYVDGLGFAYQVKPPDLYEYFRRELEGCRFDTIAGALQQYTEEILVDWTRNALAATGARRVVFGGGAAMNVKAMMQIAKLDEVDDLFLCPTPSDESLAIGAAYVFLHDTLIAQGRNPSRELKPLRNGYLGPSISDFETHPAVEALERDGGYQVRRKAEPAYIARLLARGKVLGRCDGRSEFGARALGNRSILADPRNTAVVKTINRQIKSRDFWMPFAPTIAAHRADDYLPRRKGMRAPYMTMAFETSPLAQKDLIAALHPADLTCRPQILEPDANPSYHSLIQEFEKCTGVGGVLNTSFNLHGEPIVETPRDAVRVFQLSGLDALLLNDWLIEKREAARLAPEQLPADEKVTAASL
jgi:carbamoyltransferase